MKGDSQVALFLSTFVNKIDKKGRISVPAPFRLAVTQEKFPGVILFRSYKTQALEGCALSWMDRLSHSVDTMDLFSDEQDDLAATIFADAHQLAFDSDGRISLPDALITHGGFGDKVSFVGRGSTFQLWEPKAFAEHQEHARAKALKRKTPLQLNHKETS